MTLLLPHGHPGEEAGSRSTVETSPPPRGQLGGSGPGYIWMLWGRMGLLTRFCSQVM